MIAWGALGTEFVVSLVAAVGIVAVFALGLRLLAVGAPLEARASAGEVESVADGELPLTHPRPPWASLAAYVCFAIAIAGVLYGIYLIIPQFH